ncbi:MAG TPA: HIT domain-containing protein [Anaerolineales bacterium]|nr:HIT domain-containing protein [Anaerolineales bacterium]
MDHLFTPWRMTYITNNHKPQNGCVFCQALAEPDSAENLIVYRGERAFAILNRFPYASGHVMVLPYDHQPTLEALDPATRAEMMELTTRATQTLTILYHPQGFNVGINLGEAAGAGVAAHLHIHIVPRWVGDVNFMTAVGETRILPEALEVTWQKVKDAWERRT